MINVAVLVEGRRPMGAKVSLLKELIVQLNVRHANGTITVRARKSRAGRKVHDPYPWWCWWQQTVCRKLEDFAGYSQPGAPSALLKCAILYCG